jgi:hypothetical protein
LLETGNIVNMPALVAADFERAINLYGPPVEYVRGKTVKRAISRAVVDDHLVLEQKRQVMYTDIMNLDGQKFLVSLCEPLQLTVQTHIERETQTALGVALQSQLNLVRTRGFYPVHVHCDPQSAFRSITTQFPGVVIDPSGAGDCVPKVDQKIRRIKEIYRCVKSGLLWRLPIILVKNLVAYAVARINILHTTAINQTVVPRVLFMGIRVDFNKELSLAFGDYCEVYNGTDNTSRSRTVPCIALHPCNNATGSWTFYNLHTNVRIRCSQWTK